MVSKKMTGYLAAMIVFVFALSSCAKAVPTEDPIQKITEIASTVQAELTQISALTPTITPTFTPTVTATLAPPTATLSSVMATPTMTIRPVMTGTSSDNAKWIDDVTIPDNSVISPGAAFIKTWKIENTGKTTWNKDYQLIYLEGLQGSNGTMSVKLAKDVAPGEQVNVSVNFTAPAENGSYISWWKMYSASGYIFGEPLSLRFSVGSVTPTPTANP
ncbi:MAG: hypothetical protein C0401_03450 [Anaerolinea sp.]|nr:hypothetical protein [Anaerolinea sp.]